MEKEGIWGRTEKNAYGNNRGGVNLQTQAYTE